MESTLANSSVSTTSAYYSPVPTSTYRLPADLNWTSSRSSPAIGLTLRSTMTSVVFHPPPEHSIASSVIKTIVLFAIWVPAIIGNILTCLVVYRSRRLQSTTNYFVVSLACADLLLAILAMPFVLVQVITQRWAFLPFMCSIVRFVQYLVPGTTCFVFVSICVDRFYTILHPLSFAVTRTRAKQLVLCSWLIAILLASPAFFLFQVENRTEDTPVCMEYVHNSPGSVGYVVLVAILAFVIPVIVSVGFYFRIARFIWRVGIGGRTFQRTTNPVPRAKVKMVKMLMVLDATTVLLIGPFMISQLVRCFLTLETVYEEVEALYVIVVWIYFSSAASKPILYVSLNSNFRRGCKEVFCMSTMKCYRSHAYTITTMSTLAKKNHVGVIDRSIGGSETGNYGSGTAGWTSVSTEFQHHHQQQQHQGAGDEHMISAKLMFTDHAQVMNDKSAWPGSGDFSPSTFV